MDYTHSYEFQSIGKNIYCASVRLGILLYSKPFMFTLTFEQFGLRVHERWDLFSATKKSQQALTISV